MSSRKKHPPQNRCEAGQSLIELTIGMTIILVLLAGIVDLGRAFISYQAIREAAQEGAIYASIHPGDAVGIEARARGTSQQPVPMADPSLVEINTYVINIASGERFPTSSAPSLLCRGNLIEVEIAYSHVITMPFMEAFVGGPEVELVASSQDTILKPECP